MTLKVNRFVFFVLIKITIVLSITAVAQSRDSGGGMGIIFPDQRVRLLDYIQPSSLPEKPMDTKSIQTIFFNQDRYVKVVANEFPDFFNCATQTFSRFKSELPILYQIIDALNSTRVLAVEFRLLSTNIINFSESNQPPLPIFSNYSPSIPFSFQEPLASFVNGRIWVSRRFHESLPPKDQCGLAVHEALRLINFGDYLEKQLSTYEIEIATRYIMNKSFPDDNYEVVVHKMNQIKPNAEQYRQISKELLNKSKKLGEYRFKHWNELTEKQRDELESKEWELLNKASEATTKAVTSTLKNPEINKFIKGPSIIESTALKIGLTSDLEVFEYFDTISNKIVYRPW